jgi:predicted Zn-dependent protease
MLAGVLAYIDFNFPDAEREFKRTLDLDPNEATARTAYANVLLILRRPDEAMPQIERAVAIDPLDLEVRVFARAPSSSSGATTRRSPRRVRS